MYYHCIYLYMYIYTSRISLSKLSSLHSVVGLGSMDCNATVYATQLLNSLKCFPDPLCMHGVVNLSSTDCVVTVYATQLLNSLKCFPEPLRIHRVVGLSSIYGVVGPHAMHGAWHGVCRLFIIRTTS